MLPTNLSQPLIPNPDKDIKTREGDQTRWGIIKVKPYFQRNQDPLCMMESFLTLLCPTQAYPCFKNIFFLTHLVAIYIYPCLPNHLLICIKKPSWFWHQLETKSYIKTNISISLFLQISRTRFLLRGVGFVRPKICIKK